MELITLDNLSFFTTAFLAAIDIFRFKNIDNAVVFHCYDLKHEIILQKIFQDNGIRIATIHIEHNVSYKMPFYFNIGMALNTSCGSWEWIFSDTSKSKGLISWVLFTETLPLTLTSLFNYPMEIDSDITIMSKGNRKYLLHEAYNTGYSRGGHWVVKGIGYWDSSLHMKISKRIDLTGIILNYIVVLTENIEHETFEHFLENMGPRRFEVDTVHKFKFFTLLKYIREMYNFTYKLQRTNSWGYFRNGSFEGLVGGLQWGSADVGATAVFLRADRAKIIDYVAEIWPTKPHFILRQPKYPGGFYSVYTRPLNNSVWYCVLVTLLLTALCLITMLKLKFLMAVGDEDDNAPSLAFLFVLSAISQQGISISRSSNSVKILVFVTFLFSLTLYQYYNAMVVSTLLQEPPRTIKNLKDLLQSNFKAGVEDVIYNKDFFKHTTDPVSIELFDKKIVTSGHDNYLMPAEGMALVKRGGYAFLVDTPIAYYIMRKTFNEKEICDMQEVALYPPQSIGAVVKKRLPYKEHFSYGFRKMLESGVMYRLKTMWDEPRPQCVRTPDASIFCVTIYEFSMALVLLLLGMIAAVLVLICEIFVHKAAENHRLIKFSN